MGKKLESVIETEKGAAILLSIIVEKWGAKDLIYCMFDVMCENDQNEFLNAAVKKMEVAR